MPRKRKSKSNSSDRNKQLELDFDSIINSESHEVLSRDAVVNYDPIQKTAEYMRQVLEAEKVWRTTIDNARKKLLETDPRQLYLDFFLDLKSQIEQGSSKSSRLAKLFEQVAIRGFGMTREQIKIEKPPQGSNRWKVYLNLPLVEKHLQTHIEGKYFLNQITANHSIWGGNNILIGASDVSQHRSAVPAPARFFMRSVPFILNNAAGAVLRVNNGQVSYEPARFNPQPNQELLKWMLIDPSYEEELEPEDFHRCIASAMDVGQYIFDHQYLLNADKSSPDIILRDGSLFPQDAYLDNFLFDNRRGEFIRKAIKELHSCLDCAKNYGKIYCGVAKNVRLKVYSAVLDWYITRNIDDNWESGSYIFTDGQAMTLLLSSPSAMEDGLENLIITCLIRRSFTTRANLNIKANLNDLNSYFEPYINNNSEINIKSYQSLCNLFHMYMFFVGHSKTPRRLLPRYEFFYHKNLGKIEEIKSKILSSIRYSSIDIDSEHSFMSEDPIDYLIPKVTLEAHCLSKDLGQYITDNTKQKLMSQYKSLLSQMV